MVWEKRQSWLKSLAVYAMADPSLHLWTPDPSVLWSSAYELHKLRRVSSGVKIFPDS